MGKKFNVAGKPLEPNEVAIPCGIAAYTFFNDSYAVSNDSIIFTIYSRDIAWEQDKKNFKNGDLSKQWIDLE